MDIRNTLGPYLNPRVISMMFFSIAGGIPFLLITSTLGVWLADEGLSTSASSTLRAFAQTPYGFKFLWAHIIHQNGVPFLKRLGHYRSWIMTSQLCIIVGLIALAFTQPGEGPVAVTILGMLVSFFSSTHDIAMGGYRIYTFKDTEQGYASGASGWGFRIGILISGAYALRLADQFSWSTVYVIMACIMSIGLLTVLLNPEPPRSEEDQLVEAYNLFKVARILKQQFFDTKPWFWIFVYIACYKVSDAIMNTFTWQFLNDSGFTKTQVSNAAFASFFPSIVGSALGGIINSRLNVIAGMLVTAFLHIFTSFIFVGQTYHSHSELYMISALAFENFSCGFGTATIFTFFSLITSKHYAAIQFALFTASASLIKSFLLVKPLGVIAGSVTWREFFLFISFFGFASIFVIAKLAGLLTSLKQRQT